MTFLAEGRGAPVSPPRSSDLRLRLTGNLCQRYKAAGIGL